MKKEARIAILGSTGSIGRQTIDVVERLRRTGRGFEIVALAAGRNLELFGQQIEAIRPQAVCVARKEDRDRLLTRYPDILALHGEEGLSEIARLDGIDIVVNALVGAIGLRPTLSALEQGKIVALANKETLVIGGGLVKRALADHGGRILPIDSEHSALLQALLSGKRDEVRRLIITASGGPFLNTPLSELERVRPAEALNHPKWRMGERITIDSATMVNKGFEVVEAHHLFGIPYDRIDVVIHPDSIVHSLVEYVDGSIVAQLATHDMRIPIQYALTYPDRLDSGLPRLRFDEGMELSFLPLDTARFPAFSTVLAAARAGGSALAAINAADEVLVSRFLNGDIPFTGIARGLATILSRWEEEIPLQTEPLLPDLLRVDRWARAEAADLTLCDNGGLSV